MDYKTADTLESFDLKALQRAVSALQGPQAALEAIRTLIIEKYGLNPQDSFNLEGKIVRQPEPAPEDNAKSE